MRIVFFGTPLEAAGILRTLKSSKHEVIACFTQPDRPKGRGLNVEPSPVKKLAAELGIKVFEPDKLSEEKTLNALKDLNADICVVVAYGKIIPAKLLQIPKRGMINIHASLLPKYRGAAPVRWAILNGEKRTGVTIFKLVQALDAGDIISSEEVLIEDDDNYSALSQKLFLAGSKLLLKTLDDIESGKARYTKQDEQKVSFAPKLTKEIGAIDWKESAEKISNKTRALSPHPGAFTFFKGKLLKIWKANKLPGVLAGSKQEPGKILELVKNSGFAVMTSDGVLLVEEVQKESSKKMNAWEFVIGHQLKCGDILPS